MNKIRVLVVDDSALMRKIISDMINGEDNMEVIYTAKNGEDFLNNVSSLAPDVITMDVEMPKIDGLTVLRELKKNNIKIPVIMLSSATGQGAQVTMDCLEAGAFDFISKPSGSISLDINKVKEDLVQKISLAAERATRSAPGDSFIPRATVNKPVAPIVEKRTFTPPATPVRSRVAGGVKAVVMGASTGGPKALYEVITKLPKDLGVPVFVVQHMPEGFTKAFAERLDANSNLKVVEAEDMMIIEKNTVYIAKGGYHMLVNQDKRIHLSLEPSIWGVRPAVDKLFFSAVKVYGSALLSVILTGMGRDGADGTAEIKNNGGITISEDKSTCTIYGMPKAAYETGKVDLVLPLHKVSDEITRIVEREG
ncbi:MAG: protein-glutamate methylesterase/protein-glutamine glutaminase [Solirubrobacterales bacterium]